MSTGTTETWKLTGKPAGGGQCEHCPRALVHRYEVTSSTGRTMIVGRGCLKAVTGWTLTAAQAERALRAVETEKRRAANWEAFTAVNPDLAAVLDADWEAYQAAVNIRLCGGGAIGEVRELAPGPGAGRLPVPVQPGRPGGGRRDDRERVHDRRPRRPRGAERRRPGLVPPQGCDRFHPLTRRAAARPCATARPQPVTLGYMALIAAPGVPVWCVFGPGLPAGARVTRIADRERLWLDVCLLGHHLPQLHRPAQIGGLPQAACAALGLCPDCLGFGTLAALDGFYPYGVDEVPGRCATCHGTGRPCLRVSTHRTPSGTEGSVRVLPHNPVIRSDIKGVTGDLCLACGNEAGSAAHRAAA